MNKEEAIEQLETLKLHCEGNKEHKHHEPWGSDIEALDFAIKTIEQTEVIKKATEDILEHRHAIYSREDECFNTGLETAYALIKAVLDEDEDIPMEYLEAGGTL